MYPLLCGWKRFLEGCLNYFDYTDFGVHYGKINCDQIFRDDEGAEYLNVAWWGGEVMLCELCGGTISRLLQRCWPSGWVLRLW
ncbi:hypothetical protein CsSME_00043135 [Camellia sinensis var. sinensis]